MEDIIVEFAGLTREAAALIENFREVPSETKSDIFIRVLSALAPQRSEETAGAYLELGQGARVRVGDELILFLSEEAKRAMRPHGTAEVRSDGLYVFGKKVMPSKGSVLQPAMREVQERVGHRNESGEIISLSAWRQWHVRRNGKLVPVYDLKDPKLARRRLRLVSDSSAEELGL